jgi:NodT family efflux transporter outer membrane factor (OMF) lipoprotein
MKPFFFISAACYASAILMLTACSLAPDYKTPETPEPAAYKETGDWVDAQPQDAIERGAWWKIFGDPQLDAFEDQVTDANQNLKVALAQYDQARAAASIARAAYFPVITANASATRQQTSRTVANSAPLNRYDDYTMGADLSYEIDIWGRVRNLVTANEDQAEASAADLANVELSLHAELAGDYFTLRGDDAAQDVLDKTVAADQQAFDLTEQRYKGGIAAEADVDQAQTQIENARTQATDMRLQRAQMEHAIAILTGKAPADFNLAPAPGAAKLPRLDTGLPSTLLQRRPDIAAAERRAAAANAEIGVARAAYFPTFDLTAMLGVESASATRWLTAPSQFWSLGPSALMPVFEGGQISALNDEARAAYEQAAATYRQTVLTAYGEVEDNLAALHRLEQEDKTQTAATAAAERALTQANDLYKNGATTYLDVVVAQTNELQAKLASITISIRRLNASVQLVEALGGGWQPAAQ